MAAGPEGRAGWAVIDVQGLVKVYGGSGGARFQVRALDGVTFAAARGEWLVIVGSNGVGKTTLLRVLAALEQPTAGRVCIDGCCLPRDAQLVRQRVGFVSHAPLLYGDLSAGENLRFYAAMYGVRDPRARLREVLDLVGLDGQQERLVRTLSQGMAQRLALARALLHDPPVLLLDEPYAGLDGHIVAAVEELLGRLVARGRTVVLTTHVLERGLAHASRVLVLEQGRVAGQVAAGGDLRSATGDASVDGLRAR
jgi:heme exporter protein A